MIRLLSEKDVEVMGEFFKKETIQELEDLNKRIEIFEEKLDDFLREEIRPIAAAQRRRR